MKTVGKGTVETRGKGKFRLRVSVGYDDGASKRLYKKRRMQDQNRSQAHA